MKSGALTFVVDLGYLQEDDVFDTCQLLTNWEHSASPFLRKAAGTIQVGDHGSLPPKAFVELISEIALGLQPNAAVAMDVVVASLDSGQMSTYVVAHMSANVSPPLEADNPGFCVYGLEWFAQNRPKIRMWIMQELFWVEVADE